MMHKSNRFLPICKQLPIIILISILAACSSSPPPSAGSLSFTTIEQINDGATIGQQQYNALEPGVMIIASLEDADRMGDWFTESGRQALKAINYDRGFAVAVFQGWQINSGYGVTIEQVNLAGEYLLVSAAFTVSNNNGGPVSSPYHLVNVRGLLPQENMLFRLVANGEIVAEAPTPTPGIE